MYKNYACTWDTYARYKLARLFDWYARAAL